ncbi:MAG TPA: DUF520 family protein, partial [Thermomicrobiaceae bacterium]|nr:DUF520 family protein [Thermomicrobiaceae bacterium]
MASSSSFDVVSEFDQQELRNAVDQAQREIGTRYDLKDSKSTIAQEPAQLTIESASEFTLQAVVDILESKVLRRNL